MTALIIIIPRSSVLRPVFNVCLIFRVTEAILDVVLSLKFNCNNLVNSSELYASANHARLKI
jgi:hypothetical protein